MYLALMEVCQEPPPAKRHVLLRKALSGQAAFGSVARGEHGEDAAHGVWLNGQASFRVVAGFCQGLQRMRVSLDYTKDNKSLLTSAKP